MMKVLLIDNLNLKTYLADVSIGCSNPPQGEIVPYQELPIMKITVLLLLMVQLIPTANGAFDEAPAPQTVVDGERATFRCRHSSADSIRWKVDHAFITANPPADITPNTVREDDVVVHTLTIIAHPEYDGTVIECVALFDDQTPNEQTDPVALQVINGALVGRFIETPLSLNTTYGETALFFCQHQNADHLNWDITPSNLSGHFNQSSTGGRYKLSAYLTEGAVDYNTTTIQCLAFFDDSPTQATDPATLLIQGQLTAVDKLRENRTQSTLTWDPPFSLNLTNAEPDIVYCVEVYNITCGRRDLVVSDCNVTEPNYTSDDIAPDGYIYEYTVTPRSNVEGARNGTSLTLKDEFPVLGNWTLENLWPSKSLATHVDTALNLPLPFSYTLILEPLDRQGHTTHHLMISADKNGSIVYFDLSSVPLRRLFSCTLIAYGCKDDSSSLVTLELSTHDVQKISLVAAGDRIMIEGYFIYNSKAKGLFVIVYSAHDPDSYPPQYHLITRRVTNKSGTRQRKLEFELTGLGAGEVLISIFVVEKNGLPFSRVATRPNVVHVSNSSSAVPQEPFAHSIDYSVQPEADGACITCIFKRNSSATDCLIVVHQRLSQVNLSGLMSIETNWTRRFTRHGGTATGCVPGVDLELYQIGVADGKQVSARTTAKVYTIPVVTTVLLLLLGIALLIITIIIVMRKRSRGTDYEVVAMNKYLNMKQNGKNPIGKNMNKYVDYPSAGHDHCSNTEMPTYTSNPSIATPFPESEVQSEKGVDPTDGYSGEASTPPNKEYSGQLHDSSDMVSQEQHPSESDVCDDRQVFTCDPIEVIDQPTKTELDLGASIQCIIPDDGSLIQPTVKCFPVLLEKHDLPKPNKALSRSGFVDQPVTTEPLPYNQQPGDEVALPGQCRTSSLVARQSYTAETLKDLCGIDTDAKPKTADEFVTGLRK